MIIYNWLVPVFSFASFEPCGLRRCVTVTTGILTANLNIDIFPSPLFCPCQFFVHSPSSRAYKQCYLRLFVSILIF
jgi:hypothetical protein